MACGKGTTHIVHVDLKVDPVLSCSLHYDEQLKEYLLRFATTQLLFSAKGVNQHILTCNRMILLHGPPGTGKVYASGRVLHQARF
jgi:SpoVK/Ycf46/Vps4 family AAA+-type ATPase